jgi:release factor glutamine methyltransferase
LNAMETNSLPKAAPDALMDVRAALREGISRLREANVPSQALAAELLLMHALGRDRTWLYSHPKVLLEPIEAENYFALVERRAAGEPTQYLTGKQEFWGLEFEVNSSVLIPRPETEHVVEVALQRLRASGVVDVLDSGAAKTALRVVDVGTGSGCIAVALARELPHAEIFATDVSEAAVEVARRNTARHGVSGRIHFVNCDLLAAFIDGADRKSRESRGFDLIVSNPPYVSRDNAGTLAREVLEHEPHAALFGGQSGSEIYARLIEQAASLVLPAGSLVLELGYSSAPHVKTLLVENSAWTNVEFTNDLAGIPRVIAAQRR